MRGFKKKKGSKNTITQAKSSSCWLCSVQSTFPAPSAVFATFCAWIGEGSCYDGVLLKNPYCFGREGTPFGLGRGVFWFSDYLRRGRSGGLIGFAMRRVRFSKPRRLKDECLNPRE